MKLLLASFIIFFQLVSLQGQTLYGLKDCISIGLEKNFSILIAENNEEIAKNNYTFGNAGFLPSVELAGRHGGSLMNNETTSFDDSKNNSRGNFSTNNSASISMTLPIFNGFNAITSYKRLGELNATGRLNTQLSIENLISDIVSGYYNLILQVQLMNNLRYALKLSRERLRIDQDRYLLGAGSKLEVLQSQVYVNTDSSALSRQDEIVRVAKIRLNQMLAIDDPGANFISKDTTIEINPELIYERLLDETFLNNTNLQIASRNKVISKYDYNLITSRSYPYLNFSGGYNFNYNTSETGISKTVQSDGLNYGLTLGFNLFDGFNQRRSIKNADISIEISDLQYREIEQGIKSDLLIMYNSYSNNLRLINLEEQNLETASENNDIALERYRLGSLSGIELREVQLSLLNATERVISAHYQTKLAEVSLNLISGNIMTYYE
ncbi:MAG TPA: TolC family protein [Bacteroidales bacterium]|nr:TolC family protein [Bacteroidales bacterium]